MFKTFPGSYSFIKTEHIFFTNMYSSCLKAKPLARPEDFFRLITQSSTLRYKYIFKRRLNWQITNDSNVLRPV